MYISICIHCNIILHTFMYYRNSVLINISGVVKIIIFTSLLWLGLVLIFPGFLSALHPE